MWSMEAEIWLVSISILVLMLVDLPLWLPSENFALGSPPDSPRSFWLFNMVIDPNMGDLLKFFILEILFRPLWIWILLVFNCLLLCWLRIVNFLIAPMIRSSIKLVIFSTSSVDRSSPPFVLIPHFFIFCLNALLTLSKWFLDKTPILTPWLVKLIYIVPDLPSLYRMWDLSDSLQACL